MKSENFKKLLSLAAFAALATLVIWAFYFSPCENARAEFAINSARRLAKACLCAAWLTLFLAWISRIRWQIGGIILSVLFLVSAFFTFVGNVFKLPYSYGLLVDSLQTNWQEASGFVSVSSVAFFVMFFVSMFVLAFLLGKIRLAFPRQKIFLLGVPVFLFAIFAFPIARACVFPIFRIDQVVRDTVLFYETDAAVLKHLSEMESAGTRAERASGAAETSPLVVLHIGESVRADHAPFNGYSRNTMPRVQKEFSRGNVVSFPKCVSFSISTRLSVLGILTPATIEDHDFSYGSFIPALNACGIATAGYFSSLPQGGGYYDSALQIATKMLAEKNFFPKTSDFAMADFAAAIDSAETQNFFLYYGEGAHVPATNYNREKYDVFRPSARDYAENISRLNAYDNCIFATDDFVGNAIDAMREKDAVYIYVADHGDMLGEDEYWARNPQCYRREEMRHVLFFVWCSDKFKKLHPEKYKTLLENRKRLEAVSHDFIYHSVLSLYGIKTPQYAEKFDLFSPRAETFPGELPERTEFGEMYFNGVSAKWNKGNPADADATARRLKDREKRLARKRAENENPENSR